jgi:hypothetical protein
VYIGQCYPCDALITDVISEHNGLGYSGTNAGGNLLIVNSTWRFNRAGIVPNSGSYEGCYPQRATTIVGNIVYGNDQPDTPAIDAALLAMGNGILLTGGNRNVIERNLVFDHERTGIGLLPYPDEDARAAVPPESEWDTPCAETEGYEPEVTDPSQLAVVYWDSTGNRVVGNDVSASGMADLAVATISMDVANSGNCFSDNTYTTSAPLDLEALAPCAGAATASDWTRSPLDLGVFVTSTPPPSVDYETAPLPDPGPQPNLPDAERAPARPARGPETVDVDAIALPARPPGT